MDTNRINEINAEVHKSTDLDGALSVYNLLKVMDMRLSLIWAL